jgi:hypothetical protein
MAPNSEEDGPRLTSEKDGIWGNHDDNNSKVSEDEVRNSSWPKSHHVHGSLHICIVYESRGPKFIRPLHCDFIDLLCFARCIGFTAQNDAISILNSNSSFWLLEQDRIEQCD